MASREDPFLKLAIGRVQSPAVKELFEELARRAEEFSDMWNEFVRNIRRNREIREGKPFRLTKAQRRTLANFDRDAEQAVREMELVVAGTDDAALLRSASASVDREIADDEYFLSSYHDDDKPMARRLMDYRRETKRLIDKFIENRRKAT